MADGLDDYPFAIVTDSSVTSDNKVDGEAVVVFKKVNINYSCVRTLYLLFSITVR